MKGSLIAQEKDGWIKYFNIQLNKKISMQLLQNKLSKFDVILGK